ncbi:glycosyltransferase family A protein [Pseudomonas sp. SO81]|uniref:glycosyltransferase family 2 protein n=1 Tax=Pseudomonas sp. SO81 TaxID=2983246 RepID=UPI0025A360F7|nr:glycosyltransferase family A protein [Pseudomonas sp. SO81]
MTTCKGRLHHIQQTLPTIIAESPAEIILVDYGCPDNTGNWVEEHYPEVKVIRVNDDPGFCLPRARNIGAAHSSSPWLCFIDADIKVKSGWLDWMRQNLEEGSFYRPSLADGRQLQEIAGTFLCTRAAFTAARGYDDVVRGWGGEDIDLYARLPQEGNAQPAYYPNRFVEPISHADDERTTFHTIKNISIQSLINSCYVKVKAHLHSYGIRDIPFAAHQHMLNTISDSLKHHKLQPATFIIRLQMQNLMTVDSRTVDLSLEVARPRRYGLFGARKTSVRVLAERANNQ